MFSSSVGITIAVVGVRFAVAFVAAKEPTICAQQRLGTASYQLIYPL